MNTTSPAAIASLPRQILVLRTQLQRERLRNQQLAAELGQLRQELQQLRAQMADEIAEQLQLHTLQWQLFQRLSQEMGTTLDYADLLRSILGHIHLLVPCDISAGILVDTDTCELFLHHHRPLSTSIQTEVLHRLLMAHQQLNDVDFARQALRLHHLNPPEQEQGEVMTQMATCVLVPMIMPLQPDTRLAGMLLVGAEVANSFTAEHESIIHSIANQAAVSLQQLQLALPSTQRIALDRTQNAIAPAFEPTSGTTYPVATPPALSTSPSLTDLKSRVIRTISHEYRTPLTVISLAAESLAQDYPRLNAAQRQRCFTEINRATRQMTRLVNEVLWISQAEAGDIMVQIKPMQLGEFMQQALAFTCRLQPQWRDRVVYVCPEPETLTFSSDATLLQAIVQHLLTNALKYSPAETLVQLHIRVQNQTLQLTVRDRGVGIPEAEHPHIFDCFHRAENVCTLPGTGMGLTIVKRSVDLLGGTIQFQSLVGVGTTFTVQIPLAESA